MRHPVQPDDRPVPAGGHDLDLFIFIELVIDGLGPFQGAAGILIGKHDDPLDIAQLFPGRGLKTDIEGDVLPARNPPGVAEHLDYDLTGDPVVGFQEELPGVGKGGDFRAEPAQEGGHRLRRLRFEIFDDGPGIKAAVMFIHGGELSLAQTGGGHDLIRRAQPGRDDEIGQKISPATPIKGSAAPSPTFSNIGRESAGD